MEPGRGAPIETTFKQEVVQTLKLIDTAYADWMITIYCEVEKAAASLPPMRLSALPKRRKKGMD